MIFYYWLIFGTLFLFLELFNPGFFFFFSFFFGSLGAAFFSYYELSVYMQVIGFFAVTVCSFVFFYWVFKKNLFGIMPQHGFRTNIYALQGKKAEVLEKIEPFSSGLIKVDGELWSAKSNEVCTAGSHVRIVTVVGCHCVVTLLHENE